MADWYAWHSDWRCRGSFNDQNAGAGETVTYTNAFAQAAGNSAAFRVQPVTISIGNVSRAAGSLNPAFTTNYPAPLSDYLKSLLANLTFATNAPASGLSGIYEINALVPASLVGSIVVRPGALTITGTTNLLVNNGNPLSVATIPAALETQPPPPPAPLPPVSGASSSADQLIPGNAVSRFQVMITPSQNWAAGGFQTSTFANDALSHASLTETSPDGRTNDNKSTYAAGAQK